MEKLIKDRARLRSLIANMKLFILIKKLVKSYKDWRHHNFIQMRVPILTLKFYLRFKSRIHRKLGYNFDERIRKHIRNCLNLAAHSLEDAASFRAKKLVRKFMIQSSCSLGFLEKMKIFFKQITDIQISIRRFFLKNELRKIILLQRFNKEQDSLIKQFEELVKQSSSSKHQNPIQQQKLQKYKDILKKLEISKTSDWALIDKNDLLWKYSFKKFMDHIVTNYIRLYVQSDTEL